MAHDPPINYKSIGGLYKYFLFLAAFLLLSSVLPLRALGQIGDLPEVDFSLDFRPSLPDGDVVRFQTKSDKALSRAETRIAVDYPDASLPNPENSFEARNAQISSYYEPTIKVFSDPSAQNGFVERRERGLAAAREIFDKMQLFHSHLSKLQASVTTEQARLVYSNISQRIQSAQNQIADFVSALEETRSNPDSPFNRALKDAQESLARRNYDDAYQALTRTFALATKFRLVVPSNYELLMGNYRRSEDSRLPYPRATYRPEQGCTLPLWNGMSLQAFQNAISGKNNNQVPLCYYPQYLPQLAHIQLSCEAQKRIISRKIMGFGIPPAIGSQPWAPDQDGMWTERPEALTEDIKQLVIEGSCEQKKI